MATDWIAKHWRNALELVGSALDDRSPGEPAPATRPTPEPAAPHELWLGVDFRNLADFNRRGRRTHVTRIPRIVEDIATQGRDVVCVLELANPNVADFSDRMNTAGYSHAAGGSGRHIYVRTGVHTVGRKILDIRPRLGGDDKQGIAVEVTVDSGPALVVTAHLEYRDGSESTQVAQAVHLVDQAEAYAAKRGIPASNIVWAVDTNSKDRVRAEVFEPRGYVDVFDVAQSVENPGHRSFVPWGGRPVLGRRIDLIAVHRTRPVVCARLQLFPVLSDHLAQLADIGTLPQQQ